MLFADTIYGGDGNDVLFGQEGDDRLYGEKGEDWLVGGRDSDDLVGGADKRERNKVDHGDGNSRDLREAISGLMTNWDGAYTAFALPNAPFGSTVVARGEHAHLENFDFITFACDSGLTFQNSETFTDGRADLFQAPQSGIWSVAGGRYGATPGADGTAMSVMDLGVNSNQSMSLLQLSAKVNVQQRGGFVFDYYGPDYFKYVSLDAPSDRIVIGHYTAQDGWVVDASVSRSILAGRDYTVGVALQGTIVKVQLDGRDVLGYAYDHVAVHGKVGLQVDGAAGSFDNVTVKSNDPAFRNVADYMLASSAPAAGGDTVTLAQAQLAPIVAAAIDAWTVRLGAGDERLSALDGLHVSVADLPDLALGETLANGGIVIDTDAAGYGWFVDATPLDAGEFASGDGTAGRMDLVTVVTHEIGHVLGFDHDDAPTLTVMNEDLDAGVRYLLDLGVDGDPDRPVSDQALLELAQRAAVYEASGKPLPAFDITAPAAGATGGIDWTASGGAWNGAYSPFAAEAAKGASSNFADFLVKLFKPGDDGGAGDRHGGDSAPAKGKASGKGAVRV